MNNRMYGTEITSAVGRLQKHMLSVFFIVDTGFYLINYVEQDLRKLGICNWRSRAGDRQRWRTVVREAKVRPGL